MFSTSFLLASLFWGSIGVGLCIYGKRQQSWAPMCGGIVMIAISYLVSSALLMSLISLAIIAGIYLNARRGD